MLSLLPGGPRGTTRPGSLPYIRRLLRGLGARAGDFAAIAHMLDAMPRHRADDGLYLTPGGNTGMKPSACASLPSDHFAILEVLPPFGRWDGMVTPRSCDEDFETCSFGQKKQPSPWATARICGLLRTFSAVTDGRRSERASPERRREQ